MYTEKMQDISEVCKNLIKYRSENNLKIIEPSK